MLKRRTRLDLKAWQFALALTAILAPSFALGQASASAPPNFLFIVIDDLNDHVAAFDGHPEIRTPNMDRLAQQGVRFANAYCSSPLCAPSRTSFMTGKDPAYTNIVNNREQYAGINVFRDNFTALGGNETVFTLPEILKDSAGYFTVGINKIYHRWLAQGHDNDLDTLTTDVCSKTKSWNIAFDFDPAVYEPAPTDVDPWLEGVPLFEWSQLPDASEPGLMDVLATDSAIAMLERYSTNPGAFCNRPLFMAVGYFRPHRPFLAPERYFAPAYNPELDQYPLDLPFNDPPETWPPNGLILPPQPDPIYADFDSLSYLAQFLSLGHNYRNKDRQFRMFPETLDPLPLVAPGLDSAARKAQLSKTQRANAVLAYHACIRLVDAQIGRLMDALEGHPELAANTVVVLVSDHGFALGEKRHWGKEDIHETDVRVPMAIRAPGYSAGKTSLRTVSLLDLFPTFLDLAGVSEPNFPDGSRYLDGHSLVPLLANPQASWNRPVLSTIKNEANAPDANCFRQYAVRTERFHYLRFQANDTFPDAPFCNSTAPTFFEELYEIGPDRSIDPNEWNNLANDPAYSDVMRHLANWLPDSANFGRKNMGLQISAKPMACALGPGDSVVLEALITADDGMLVNAVDPRWRVQWRLGDSLFVYGPILAFKANRWALDLLDGEGRLPVQVTAWDSLSGQSAVDVIKLTTRLGPNPNPYFTLEKSGTGVAIRNYEPGPLVQRSTWDFGDGHTQSLISGSPFNHVYSDTGTWVVQNRIYFGNEATCFRSHHETIVLRDSDFIGLPCPVVQSLALQAIAPDAVDMAWPSVWSASEYGVRIRRQADLHAFGQMDTSTSNRVYWNGLTEHTGYEVLIQSQCGSDSSAWSYPFAFQTASCLAPTRVEVTVAAPDSAQVSWIPSMDATSGHQVLLSDSAGNAWIQNLAAGQTSCAWGDLVPASSYSVSVHSQCPSLPLDSVYTGQRGTRTSFTLPSARKTLDQSSGTLSITPNPAAQQVSLTWGNERVQLTVQDLTGRIMLALPEVPGPAISIDVSAWESGYYRVIIRGSQGERSAGLVVTRP